MAALCGSVSPGSYHWSHSARPAREQHALPDVKIGFLGPIRRCFLDDRPTVPLARELRPYDATDIQEARSIEEVKK
jgi:hypothetical protein